MDEIKWTTGRKIDRTLVTNIEKTYNIQFPENYIKLVLEHDGGCPVPNAIDCGNKTEDFRKLIHFNFDEEFNMSWVLKNSRFPEGIYPFAEDSGGNSICFDYRKSSNPTIVFFDHEKTFDDSSNFWKMADSFNELISNIYDE